MSIRIEPEKYNSKGLYACDKILQKMANKNAKVSTLDIKHWLINIDNNWASDEKAEELIRRMMNDNLLNIDFSFNEFIDSSNITRLNLDVCHVEYPYLSKVMTDNIENKILFLLLDDDAISSDQCIDELGLDQRSIESHFRSVQVAKPTLITLEEYDSLISIRGNRRGEIIDFLENGGIPTFIVNDDRKSYTAPIQYNIASHANVQIQHQTTNSTQNLTVTYSTADLSQFANDLKNNIDKLTEHLSEDDINDLRSDIGKLERNINKQQPDQGKVKHIMKGIGDVLKGVATDVISNVITNPSILTQFISS